MEWEKEVVYRISTNSKKNIEQITTYAKIEDYDQKIIRNEAFRSGWVEVLGDEMSYYLDDTYDPEVGTDVWVFPTEEHEFLDGVAGDFSFSANITKEEQDELRALIDEQGFDSLEQLGWEHDDTEVLFYGELNIEKK
jgi:hypothetical protein